MSWVSSLELFASVSFLQDRAVGTTPNSRPEGPEVLYQITHLLDQLLTLQLQDCSLPLVFTSQQPSLVLWRSNSYPCKSARGRQLFAMPQHHRRTYVVFNGCDLAETSPHTQIMLPPRSRSAYLIKFVVNPRIRENHSLAVTCHSPSAEARSGSVNSCESPLGQGKLKLSPGGYERIMNR